MCERNDLICIISNIQCIVRFAKLGSKTQGGGGCREVAKIWQMGGGVCAIIKKILYAIKAFIFWSFYGERLKKVYG